MLKRREGRKRRLVIVMCMRQNMWKAREDRMCKGDEAFKPAFFLQNESYRTQMHS